MVAALGLGSGNLAPRRFSTCFRLLLVLVSSSPSSPCPPTLSTLRPYLHQAPLSLATCPVPFSRQKRDRRWERIWTVADPLSAARRICGEATACDDHAVLAGQGTGVVHFLLTEGDIRALKSPTQMAASDPHEAVRAPDHPT